MFLNGMRSNKMDIFLSHNPYTIQTFLSINGKQCDDVWFTDLSTSGEAPARLQMWIMHFFDKLHNAYPEEKIVYMKYKGTNADCQDIETEAQEAEKRLGITIKLSLQPCGEPESKFEKLKALYDEAVEGPYEGFHNIELKIVSRR